MAKKQPIARAVFALRRELGVESCGSERAFKEALIAALRELREPTGKMIEAAQTEFPHIGSTFWWGGWRLMIDKLIESADG